MPSKALLRPVELAREVARIPGLELGPIDVPAVLARRDEVIHDQDDSHPAAVARRPPRHARPRPRPARRREARRRRRGGARRPGGGDRGDGLGGVDPGHRRAARGAPVDEHRGDDGEAGAATARRPRRRRRRGGAEPDLEHLRLAGDARAPRRPPDRTRGAVRVRPGARRARGERRRRAASGAGTQRHAQRPRHGRARRRHGDRGRRGARRLRPGPGTAEIGLETIGLETAGPLRVGDDLRVPGFDWLYAIGDVNGRVLLDAHGEVPGPARGRRDSRARRSSCAPTAPARRA